MDAHPQLQEFLQAYGTHIQELFWHCRTYILNQDENAHELIWDNYNALAIAYSRSEKLKDAYCHLALYTNHINFGFNRGAELSQDLIDLKGSGKLIRHIKITREDDIHNEALADLLKEALTLSIALNPTLENTEVVPSSLVMSIAKKRIRPKK